MLQNSGKVGPSLARFCLLESVPGGRPPSLGCACLLPTAHAPGLLQDHLDAGAAGSAFATTNFSTFRALLRLARTLLRNFYPLLGPRSGTLVQALLAGAAGSWGRQA